MMAIWVLVISLLGFLSVGMGYRSGAPRDACTSMLPGHSNTVAMDTESPYRLEVDEFNSLDDRIIVSIHGSESFKGFFLQARNADGISTDTMGSFSTSTAGVMSVACQGLENTALTHTSPRRKSSVEAVWRATGANGRAVHFIATVVRSFDEYWVGITSRTVTLMKPLPTPGNITRSYTTVNTTAFPEVTSAISTTDFVPSTTDEFQLNQNYSNGITSPNDNLETTPSPETTISEVTTIESTAVTQTTNKPIISTESSTSSVTDSPLDTTLLKTSLSTPVDVTTSAEVSTPSQEITISEVTDDLIPTISPTTVQSPIFKSTTESQLNTTITTDLTVTETTTKPIISTDAATPLITKDRTTPPSEDNKQTEGPTFQSATDVYSTNEITDKTSAETSASTILPDNASTTLSVDTSATRNISTPPSTTQPVHATTVSLSDKSTPLTQPLDSSTTREVKVSATPQVTPSQTQSYIDSNTDSNDSSESPTTNSAETSPVAKSTTPPQPLTEEVTQIITVDGTEVMKFTTPTKAPATAPRSTTERVRATTWMTTAYIVREELNEVRMRLRIVDIVFTEELTDSNSQLFKRVANDVEEAIWNVYMRNGVETLESVKVLQITKGSVVPEVQMLASRDLDETTKSDWQSVMYNEINNGGKLGNFTVSDVYAVASDGTFTDVDPCFLLPCPEAMVCFINKSTCLSSCYFNTNYCLNNGVCIEPKGNIQFVSCRCSVNHEGDRCEVKRTPVTPGTGSSNVNSFIAIVWGSIGSACFVFIIITAAWLIRNYRKRRHWRHTAKLIGSNESGLRQHAGAAQMDSYARRLTAIRAGVLIDLANISISASEDESTDGRKSPGSASFSDTDSLDQPRFIDGGVQIGLGGLPDILQGASTTDYELDVMNRPLNQKRKSVSFSDFTEMIDFVAKENFALGNQDDSTGNFQVRWDFQVDQSESRETAS